MLTVQIKTEEYEALIEQNGAFTLRIEGSACSFISKEVALILVKDYSNGGVSSLAGVKKLLSMYKAEASVSYPADRQVNNPASKPYQSGAVKDWKSAQELDEEFGKVVNQRATRNEGFLQVNAEGAIRSQTKSGNYYYPERMLSTTEIVSVWNNADKLFPSKIFQNFK